MDPVSHLFTGALIAKSARAPRAHFWVLIFLSELPDVDVLFHPLGLTSPVFYHRSFTHSLLGAGLLAAGLYAAVRRTAFGTFPRGALSYLAVAWSHVLADLITSYGTPVLWPVTSASFSLDWVSNLSLVPLGILSTGLLLGRASGEKKRRAIRWTWGALGIFLALSVALRQKALALLRSEGTVYALPQLVNPLLWRVIEEDPVRSVYRVYRADPLRSTLKARGTYPMPPRSSWVDASLQVPEVRLFLKHNRWPLARLRTEEGEAVVEWGNLLFSWSGRVRGKLVVRLDKEGRVRSSERIFAFWEGG